MYEKYHTALRLMDAIVATKDMVAPEGGWPLVRGLRRFRQEMEEYPAHPLHNAWDVCFDFIFANFSKPETSLVGEWKAWTLDHPEVVDTKMLLTVNDIEIERLLRSMPPELAEQVFPVAIARFIFRESAMPLNHRILRTFEQFHDWYGPMILAY